jgi:hypothetical protein
MLYYNKGAQEGSYHANITLFVQPMGASAFGHCPICIALAAAADDYLGGGNGEHYLRKPDHWL